MAGAFHGLQAEYARIPYANVGPVKLPEGVSDDQAVLLSDIFPTGYFGLEMARAQGAEVIDFDAEDPVEAILELTGGLGVDRAIDAVGVDAVRPHRGPAAAKARDREEQFDRNRAPRLEVIEAYKAFDTRQPGWIKVELKPAA